MLQSLFSSSSFSFSVSHHQLHQQLSTDTNTNHLDAANQDASNGQILSRTPSNPLLPARDYIRDHHVHRNYFQIITFYVGGHALPGRGSD